MAARGQTGLPRDDKLFCAYDNVLPHYSFRRADRDVSPQGVRFWRQLHILSQPCPRRPQHRFGILLDIATNALDRLEGSGQVKRERSQKEQRVILEEWTPKAKAMRSTKTSRDRCASHWGASLIISRSSDGRPENATLSQAARGIAVKTALVPDPANRVISAEAAIKEKKAVAISSMAASAVMTVGKFVVGIMTGSLGLISEALHSLLDFGATMMTFMAVRVSDKPADEEHHYGHGKIEAVAALAETALLFVTSAWIIYEAIHRLMADKIEVEATWWSFGVIIASIIIDLSRARALRRTARKTNSMALEADALHFSSDVLSSSVVLVGLAFVAFGWPQGDPIAAIGVSIFVCRAGWILGRRTFDTLIDTAPEGAAERVTAAVRSVPGIAGVDRVRVRPAGNILFVHVDAAVGRGLSQNNASELRNTVVAAVQVEIPEAEVTVTMHPLALNEETIHQRAMIIAANHRAHVHHVTAHQFNDRLSISFDLEVAGSLSIQDAHRVASRLEADMRTEFGISTEVETHIEPMLDDAVEGSDVSVDLLREISSELERLAAETGELVQVHNVRARGTGLGLIVIFHCRTASGRTVAEVHQLVDKLEHRLRAVVPGIWRTVAHTEPL